MIKLKDSHDRVPEIKQILDETLVTLDETINKLTEILDFKELQEAVKTYRLDVQEIMNESFRGIHALGRALEAQGALKGMSEDQKGQKIFANALETAKACNTSNPIKAIGDAK